MFSKKNRFSFRKGLPAKYLNTKLFSLRYQKNDLADIRVAVVVSGRIEKKAVVRNMLRRRFSQALKEVLDKKKISFDLVFFLKKEICDISYQEIKSFIQLSLKGIL